MIGQTVSRYLILDVIGEGGMGTVYRAEDTLLKRRVAIKFLSADARKQHYRARFLREVIATAALTHPNIATVYDFGTTPEGGPFIVMELVEGQSLSELMQQGITISQALEIVEGIGKALAEAHAHSIVHRDIKPSNIAINKRGEVKVLDFGLAKRVTDNSENGSDSEVDDQALLATQTRENTTIGTPMYMSPEQTLGSRVDTRSDLFSLGSVLYECISGTPAFHGRTALAVGNKIVHDDPPAPSTINPQVSRRLDQITLKALAKKPEDRYQSADEMLADLTPLRESFRSTQPVPIRPINPKPTDPGSTLLSVISKGIRRPPILAASFVACLAIAFTAVWAGSSFLRRPQARSGQCLEAERKYRDGTNALRDGTYDRASKAFTQAIDLCDDYPLAHARLAETLTELEYTDKAQKELLRISQTEPAAPAIESLALQAIRTSLAGDTRNAIPIYEKIVQETQDGAERASAYVDLGRAYERDGYPAKAEASYGEALKIDPQQTAASMRLGVIYSRRQGAQNNEKALAYFAKAESTYRSTNDAEGLAEVFYQRGIQQTTQRDFVAARAELERANSNAQAIDNKYLQVKSRMQLSNVFCIQGDAASAEKYALDAVEFAKANNIEVLTANGLVTLGNSFLARGDLEQSQKYLQRALEVAEYYQVRRSKARALLALASVESQRHSRPENVRNYVERALPIIKEDGYRKWEMQAQELLGHANEQAGDYNAARTAFERLAELAAEYDDNDQASRAQEGLGISSMAQENYADALVRFDRNLESARAVGLKPRIIHALFNRGKVLWRLGRYEEAEQMFTEARQKLKEVEEPDAELIAEMQLDHAQMALSRKLFEVAKSEARATYKNAGANFAAIAAEAQSTLCLAQAFSGEAAASVRECNSSHEAAQKLATTRLISGSLLALAWAKLSAHDPAGALSAAIEARDKFKQTGQQNSEWSALVVATLAEKELGDNSSATTYAASAATTLSGIEQRLGGDAYKLFLARPDIQHLHSQLSTLGSH